MKWLEKQEQLASLDRVDVKPYSEAERELVMINQSLMIYDGYMSMVRSSQNEHRFEAIPTDVLGVLIDENTSSV